MVKENKIEEKEVLSKKKTSPDGLQVAKQSILEFDDIVDFMTDN